MKVGVLLLLVYRVFPAVSSQVECGLVSLGMLCRSDSSSVGAKHITKDLGFRVIGTGARVGQSEDLNQSGRVCHE